jgi:hypothetical protein
MTADTLQWTFLAPSLPPARRDTCDHAADEPVAPPMPEPSGIRIRELEDDLPATTQDDDLVAAIGHALLEVLTGHRAVWQLARWIDPESLDRLAAAIRVGRWTQAHLRSARASRVSPDDVLGRVCLECDGHPLTGCLRLRRLDDRWQCTQFALLLPGSQMRTNTAG